MVSMWNTHGKKEEKIHTEKEEKIVSGGMRIGTK